MKRRFRYDKDLEKVVEIFDHNQTARKSGPFFMPDLNSAYKEGGFTSPIDGQFITSRSQLAEHNRKHGVRQNGDFRSSELVNKENARVEKIRRASENKDFKWN
jgi:hypothetical protein